MKLSYWFSSSLGFTLLGSIIGSLVTNNDYLALIELIFTFLVTGLTLIGTFGLAGLFKEKKNE